MIWKLLELAADLPIFTPGIFLFISASVAVIGSFLILNPRNAR